MASLSDVLRIVGPKILQFLTEVDIFCGLELTSTDILHVVIKSPERWRHSASKYQLGCAKIVEPELNNNCDLTLVLVTAAPKIKLRHVEDISAEVLHSIIKQIVPPEHIKGDHHDNKLYWNFKNLNDLPEKVMRTRLSPFSNVCHLEHVWWLDSSINIPIYLPGRWGIFWRVNLQNARGHIDTYHIKTQVKRLGSCVRAQSLVARRKILEQEMIKFSRLPWVDLLLATIDARNTGDSGTDHTRLIFPIELLIHVYNHNTTLFKANQFYDFLYIWPLEDSEPLIDDAVILTNKDLTTGVSIVLNGGLEAEEVKLPSLFPPQNTSQLHNELDNFLPIQDPYYEVNFSSDNGEEDESD